MWQEIHAEDMNWDPFPRKKGNWFLVTAGREGACNTLLGTYGGLLSLWSRNCAAVAIRESRYTKAFLDREEGFSIAVLPEAFRDAVRYCGSHSGREGDKFAAAGLTPVFAEGIPFPGEAELVLLCRKLCACPMEGARFVPDIHRSYYEGKWENNPHTLYIGEIVKILRKA